MYVYSTYLHVIGVIIKMELVFVLNLKAQVVGFYNAVNDMDTLKPKLFLI